MGHWKYPEWVGFLTETYLWGRSEWLQEIYSKLLPSTQMLHVTLLLSVFVSTRSPGRSPSCYDNEIVMMNHVYKERFPKVSLMQTIVHSICVHASALFACLQTTSLGTALMFTFKMLGLNSAGFCDGWWRVQCYRLHEYVWMPPAYSCSYFPPSYHGWRNYC